MTVGQSFGGDLEAVTVHSGLLAAKLALGADLVILTQGPGNLGTGTRWGFSGVGAGEAVNAAAVLRRASGRRAADLRRRPPAAAPRRLPPQPDRVRPGGPVPLRHRRARLRTALPELAGLISAEDRAQLARHHLVDVDLDGLAAVLADSPVRLSSMGRGVDADPGYFLAAAAAGRHAAVC